MRFLRLSLVCLTIGFGLVSAESAIAILSRPDGMCWEIGMLPRLFWVPLVSLVGMGLGVGGSIGRSEKPPCPRKQKINIINMLSSRYCIL